jgi:hypothetical protein
LGSGCSFDECPAYGNRALYVGAVLPSEWFYDLSRSFTNDRVLTTNALADYFVDQPDKLNSNIKKKIEPFRVDFFP